VHLHGFIIRIYHDALSPERQIRVHDKYKHETQHDSKHAYTLVPPTLNFTLHGELNKKRNVIFQQ